MIPISPTRWGSEFPQFFETVLDEQEADDEMYDAYQVHGVVLGLELRQNLESIFAIDASQLVGREDTALL